MNVIIIIILIVFYLVFFKGFKPNINIIKRNVSFYLKGAFNEKFEVSNLNRGIIGIGGAGSGKTYSLIKPLLAYNIKNRGVLCFDPKGDLSPFINQLAKKHNKQLINFSLDENYDKINPISLCSNKADIIDFSSYFLSGIVGIPKNDNAKYFFNSAKSVLTGLIIFLKNKGARYATIPHVVAVFLSVSPEELIYILSSDEESKRASTVLLSIQKDPKLLGSVISTFTAFFSSLDTPNIFRNLVTTDELELPNNPKNPNVINLIFNLQKRDLYSPIYSSIVGLVLKKMNKPEQYKSAVIIDEFTCLSIPDFQNIPETARSNKIATCIAIQDFSQLVMRYGKEVASSIISNMGNQFLFRTTNPETLDHFQRMLGTRDKKQKSTNSTDFSFKTSKTTSISEKHILKKGKIINYKPGECFAIIAEGNKKLIEGKRVNGNHYLRVIKKNKPDLISEKNDNSIYNMVYRDVKFLSSKNKVSSPKKFNL